MLKQYVWNILVSLDQLANTLLAGRPNETLSGRMGAYVIRGRGFIPCQLCKLLGIIFKDKNHCINNIEPAENKGNAL